MVVDQWRAVSMDNFEGLGVVVTTSPVPSNPSTGMISQVVQSLSRLGLPPDIPICIVMDGCVVSAADVKNHHKKGYVNRADFDKYIEYKKLLLDTDWGIFTNVSFLEMEQRVGFGKAVLHGLRLLRTEYVLVAQYDWQVVDDVDAGAVMRVMRSRHDVQYCTFMAVALKNYIRTVKCEERLKIDLKPLGVGGIEQNMYPLLCWYDKTHIARASLYQGFVADYIAKDGLHATSKGTFPEDTVGQIIKQDVYENGISAHGKYGTYFLWAPDRKLAHLHGRRYLTADQLEVKGYLGRCQPPHSKCHEARSESESSEEYKVWE